MSPFLHVVVYEVNYADVIEQWAGSVWGSSSCASLASTCTAYVGANPGAFAPAYWLINSVKVYQQ